MSQSNIQKHLDLFTLLYIPQSNMNARFLKTNIANTKIYWYNPLKKIAIKEYIHNTLDNIKTLMVDTYELYKNYKIIENVGQNGGYIFSKKHNNTRTNIEKNLSYLTVELSNLTLTKSKDVEGLKNILLKIHNILYDIFEQYLQIAIKYDKNITSSSKKYKDIKYIIEDIKRLNTYFKEEERLQQQRLRLQQQRLRLQQQRPQQRVYLQKEK
jgi:hypothetical protein